MNTEHDLDMRLAALRAEMASVTAPDAIEARLLQRFRKPAPARPARPRLWWMPPLALAATVMLVSWMVRTPMEPMPSRASQAGAARADDAPFLALKPLERIALEPGSTVVTTEFPRAVLAEWGLPVPPDRAAEPVRAELLYSPDGEALAVRLIH